MYTPGLKVHSWLFGLEADGCGYKDSFIFVSMYIFIFIYVLQQLSAAQILYNIIA